MKHKNNNDSLKEVKLELYRTDILYSEFKFSCFCENILTYELEADGVMHELSIINNEKSFFNKEKAINLLDLNGLLFLSHSVSLKDEKGNYDKIACKTYAPLLGEINKNKK